MSVNRMHLLLIGTIFCMAGCLPMHVQEPSAQPLLDSKPQFAPQVKNRSLEQIQILSDFAMKESPSVWEAIQAMRGEIAQSETRIKHLRADLLEFGRNPDADGDYKALVAGLQELKCAYDVIFDKLEDAYIAAKKYEAYPRCKDYQEMMKHALEDGIQDAIIATEHYKAMTKKK